MTGAIRRQTLLDLLLVAFLGSPALLITARFGDTWFLDDRQIGAYGLTLMVVAFASLTVRRLWPIATLAIATAATTAYLLEGFPYGPILATFFIAVYTVAARLPFRRGVVSVLVALAVLLTHVFVHPSALGGLLGIIPASAWAAVPFAIGTTVRFSRGAVEADRAEAMRRQLYEERIRVAQEVHDIVGHGLAAIQMQADVALHVEGEQTPQTRKALESISRASSEAFEELRSALDVVSPNRPGRGPVSPGLADLEGLCGRMRGAGLSIDLTLTGDPRRIPPAVELATYRIAQESLTNVIRHGAVAAATLRVNVLEDAISIKVTNPGPAGGGTEGRGLSGMRRRIEALHGTLAAGPSPEGFTVEARLPIGTTG